MSLLSMPSVPARAATLYLRLGTVVIQIGVILPASAAAWMAACLLAPLWRIIRTRPIIIWNRSTPSGMQLSPIAYLAVIVLLAMASFAVFISPLKSVLLIPGTVVLPTESSRAGARSLFVRYGFRFSLSGIHKVFLSHGGRSYRRVTRRYFLWSLSQRREGLWDIWNYTST